MEMLREGKDMRCGICNQRYGDLMVKHGEVCEDDMKAPSVRYAPEIDDLIREIEEREGKDINE